TVNVAIGVDLPEKHTTMHTTHALVDRCEAFGNIRLDVRREVTQPELHRRRNSRVGRKRRHGVGRQRRLFRGERTGAETNASKRRNCSASGSKSQRTVAAKARSLDRSHDGYLVCLKLGASNDPLVLPEQILLRYAGIGEPYGLAAEPTSAKSIKDLRG